MAGRSEDKGCDVIDVKIGDQNTTRLGDIPSGTLIQFRQGNEYDVFIVSRRFGSGGVAGTDWILLNTSTGSWEPMTEPDRMVYRLKQTGPLPLAPT